MRIFHVYALADPATHVVRYVGKTRWVGNRYKAHASGNCPGTRAWVESLSAPPVLILLESGEDRRVQRQDGSGVQSSAFAETKWIKRFRRTLINRRLRESGPITWDWLCNPEA
jgi:hypothetical protein